MRSMPFRIDIDRNPKPAQVLVEQITSESLRLSTVRVLITLLEGQRLTGGFEHPSPTVIGRSD
jgi:hypothetical protein